MSYCPNCGAVAGEAAHFCTSCGAALTKGGSVESGTEPPAVAHDNEVYSVKDSQPSDETVIPRSKGKLFLCFLGSTAFVAIACAMLADESGDPRTAVAPLGILFFGATAVASLVMLFGNKPGLRLNSEGFEYSGSSVELGFVRWSEVSGWREHGIAGSRFLVVLLKDPEAFAGRMGGIGPALRVNTAMYGSPIAISSSALAVGFREFSDLFAEYFRKYGVS